MSVSYPQSPPPHSSHTLPGLLISTTKTSQPEKRKEPWKRAERGEVAREWAELLQVEDRREGGGWCLGEKVMETLACKCLFV